MIVKRDIREKRENLKIGSLRSKELAFESNLNYENAQRVRKEHQELENKFQFYDKFIKANEKVKKEKK